MKKIIILFAVFFVFINFANAQSSSFGAKVVPMLGWSNVQSTDTFAFNSEGIKPGIGIGPSLKMKLGDSFNTEVGLLFTWQGSKFSQFNDTILDYTYEIKRQYLQIPISFNGSFKVGPSTRAIMSFGGTPAIKLSSLVKIIDKGNDNLILTENYKFPGTFFNFYLTAGAGTSIEISKGVHFISTVKYNHAIIDSWYDGDDNKYIKELNEKNHFISLDLGLHIDF